MSSGLQAWAATGVATLASVYALDAISTATGALLVTSGLLHGIGLGAAMAFLLASYAAWGVALRPSLAANWALLQRTGASTCLPSKLAHDIARRRGTGQRTRKIAAASGYVGAELVKEAPYYLGAAGAVLLIEGVTSADVVRVSGGANLGAAAYEYGLAQRGTACSRECPPPLRLLRNRLEPARYLADYYRDVEPDERLTLEFLVEAARGVPAAARS